MHHGEFIWSEHLRRLGRGKTIVFQAVFFLPTYFRYSLDGDCLKQHALQRRGRAVLLERYVSSTERHPRWLLQQIRKEHVEMDNKDRQVQERYWTEHALAIVPHSPWPLAGPPQGKLHYPNAQETADLQGRERKHSTFAGDPKNPSYVPGVGLRNESKGSTTYDREAIHQ